VVYQLVTVYRSIETTTATLTPGVWQHVAAAFDGATQGMQIYINGAEIPVRLDQNSSTVMMADSIAPVNIGALTLPQGTLNGTWNGVIDEVDVFSRALSAAEVQAIYQAGNDGKCQPLQGGDGAAQTQRIYLPIVIRGG